MVAVILPVVSFACETSIAKLEVNLRVPAASSQIQPHQVRDPQVTGSHLTGWRFRRYALQVRV